MPRYVYRKPDNLVELFETAVELFPYNRLFGVKNPEGKSLTWLTYKQVGDRVDNLRSGLARMGIGKGDAVGIIANNSPEWAVAAFAAYGLEARFVPMYEAELPKIWQYIVSDAGVKVLFVSKKSVYEKVKSFPAKIKTLERIVLMEGQGPDTMNELEEQGSMKPLPSTQPGPYDTAVLIYTSGTTGDPKGVLLSHGNLTHCAKSGYHIYPELSPEARSLSILPWAHSYGQTAELYNWLQFGGAIGFMESVDTLAADMALVRPSFLIAVPRVFNKIYNGLWTKMREEGGMKLRLFEEAVQTARRKRELAEQGTSDPIVDAKLAVLDRLVFAKIRERFGGRLQGALTASATMNPDIAHFFFDMGIPVYDCYGLTETSPAVTMNCSSSYRLGSVGRTVERVKVVIDRSVVEPGAEDGEIIVYGPNVMQGYHNKPSDTAAVMTEDGGFRTGDRGRVDRDGFLYITGRIKEQFKLENGKYVFPGAIEEDIKLIPSVANAMIYGEGKPYNVCLVYPDYGFLRRYARENNLPDTPEEMSVNQQIRGYLTGEIEAALKGRYGGYEIPRRYAFLTEDFTLENGMLTQTMKLKRRVVLDKYRDIIEALYRE
ncbi:MAG TPA: long-chain fatty acid--CoA ligase [Deltaproteobacteria bacterium]|nr:long-chain fatty acid--CoA ligase [Deltaproteobacteria bacterium]HPR54691.1 long-chain fatty acid--CoA ligase [Deltaproteobacteria bacterium]HXK46645.1 long-chain fatty acid--CoA ligase [Deltaproteobacteria bacterium]